MNIQKISLNRINPATYNPRRDLKPDDSEYKQLLRSIDEYGCVQLLICNKRNINLVSGHQRLKILQAKGIKEAYVSIVDLPPEKEKALNIALNKISGDWDHDKLKLLLDELSKIPDFDVELTGFELPDIENMLADILNDSDSESNFNIDKELNRKGTAITKSGEIVELGMHGEHRLLCGDVTKPQDVKKLMEKFKAQLCNTDPPYGVNYDRRNRPTSKHQKKKINTNEARPMKIKNDDLTPKRYGMTPKNCTSFN